MQDYPNAIKCYKKQLELAWSLKDYSEEMLAYDMIAVNYFYLGDLTKSKYYETRMLRGQFEPKESKLRKIFEKQILTKREQKNEMLQK
jgi:hypothetical protein